MGVCADAEHICDRDFTYLLFHQAVKRPENLLRENGEREKMADSATTFQLGNSRSGKLNRLSLLRNITIFTTWTLMLPIRISTGSMWAS